MALDRDRAFEQMDIAQCFICQDFDPSRSCDFLSPYNQFILSMREKPELPNMQEGENFLQPHCMLPPNESSWLKPMNKRITRTLCHQSCITILALAAWGTRMLLRPMAAWKPGTICSTLTFAITLHCLLTSTIKQSNWCFNMSFESVAVPSILSLDSFLYE